MKTQTKHDCYPYLPKLIGRDLGDTWECWCGAKFRLVQGVTDGIRCHGKWKAVSS